VCALLADGTTIEIRPATPEDLGAVKAMHEAMSPDNAYRRAAEHEARATLLLEHLVSPLPAAAPVRLTPARRR
jgi:hypothetical protein